MPDQPSPALKEIFNRSRLEHIAAEIAAVHAPFRPQGFLDLASRDLETLSIMQRLRQIAVSVRETLSGNFETDIEILTALAPRINHGFASMILPEYVALYGQDHFDLSMHALAYFTGFGSSEFAVRHFLIRDLQRTLQVMENWAGHDDDHVRRLASEGSRPRLPWSFQLKALVADPSPTAGILERLKSDPSLYVRKSVANHLNDITKDHADLALQRLAAWDMTDVRTAWIVRHALRTLIKKGDRQALALIGAGAIAEVRIEDFAVLPEALSLGERLHICARIVSTSTTAQRLVVDYAVHYVKKGGASSRKVFKLKEISLAAAGTMPLSVSQVIRDFTTRKHYPGHHHVELMVNGETVAEGGFDLLPPA